jgi:hypothetical protein
VVINVIKIPTNWVKCTLCETAIARIGMVRIQRRSNDPGGSLLETAEASIRSGNLALAIGDIEKFILIAQSITPEQTALLQGACECLRQKNSGKSWIGKYALGFVPRVVGWLISYLLQRPGNPLNYFPQFPESAAKAIVKI